MTPKAKPSSRIVDKARFDRVIAAIDAANDRDPSVIEFGGAPVGAELVYGMRMTDTLAQLAPDASECLRIAARGQHIERWIFPRRSYPKGRAGYLQWRKVQRQYQARRLGELMADCGYGTEDTARVGALIRKEKRQTDAEVQMLEDVICIMFFKHYLKGFASRIEDDKLADILAKTWSRMSDYGHQHALALKLAPRILGLMDRGLARLTPAPS